MRVIAGKAKSLRLKTIDGMDTRPTTDRIKETLFNMISPQVADSIFLDLFAGSGAIGIEALSRGADCCVFVEQQKRAADCIRDNLRFTKLFSDATVLCMDAVSAIRKLDGQKAFSIIFMDPPYRKNLEWNVMSALIDTTLIDEDTLVIVEAALETEAGPLEALGYELVKEKKYKTNKHMFFYKGGNT